LQVDKVYQGSNEVIIKGRQKHYIQTAKGLGRASRLLANELPQEIKKFTFVETYNGIDISSVTINRLRFEKSARLEQPQKRILSSTTFAPKSLVKQGFPVFIKKKRHWNIIFRLIYRQVMAVLMRRCCIK